ncbi:MAG: hypothetical protein K0U98_12125 [Deltaproteobacteria bacterium]|nr:hypothetical protein [Deltaproteobacteria bacterium]
MKDRESILLSQMYSTVRVVRLIGAAADYDFCGFNQRSPAVGDTGTLIHTLEASDLPMKFVVENCDDKGVPIWLAEFVQEELELVE